jgi:phosphatidylglycerol---prolipoprotein diacylglyceryl transferase
MMPQHQLLPANPAYAVLMAASILIGALFWYRRAKGNPDLLIIYIGALCGAFMGAKLAYLIAEGWLDIGKPHLWLRWATGKSVLGGLIGGYAGVEWTKHLVGHKASTGDAFALIMPFGLMLGRLGCYLNGCCLGKPISGVFSLRDAAGISRWPAPAVEGAFQILIFLIILILQKRGLLRDRLFFLYLITYGLFRFGHEFMRDTPKIWLGLSGYQGICLVMMLLGTIMLKKRSQSMLAEATTSTNLAP